MSILTAEKIFIDQKEEITFIIDRVLSSNKNKVIFIVPQGALLLSSPISSKILFKEVSKLKKAAVVVTEDPYGINLAERVGFVVEPKVSQINGESWQVAVSRMENYLEKLNMKKQELSTQVAVEDKLEEEKVEHADAIDGDEEVAEVKEDVKEETQEDEKVEEIEKENETDAKEAASVAAAAAVSAETTEALKNYAKPRMDAKVVDLDGIELFAGGDIKKIKKAPEQYDKIQDINNIQDDFMAENIPADRVRKMSASGKFTGKDFTRVVQKPSGISSFFDNLFRKRRPPQEDTAEYTLAQARRKKIIMVVGGLVGLGLLILVYLMAFEFSSVDVRLKFKTEEIPVTATVLANPNATELSTDTTPIAVPAQVLTVEKISGSWTGAANGAGKKGTKSAGVVSVYNTSSPTKIVLAAGTKLTNQGNNKQYVFRNEVSIDGIDDGGGVPGAKVAEDVQITGIDFGAEYDLDCSVANCNFIIEGYQFSNLYAKGFDEIKGGVAEAFTTPTQENIDTLKTEKLKELKTQAENKLRNIIPVGSILVPETIEYTETAVTTVPKVGEEAKDKTFTLSVELAVSGYSIKNEDLKEAGEFVLTSDQESEGSTVVVDNLKTPTVTKVEKNPATAGGFLLTITSAGSVGLRPSEDEIRSNIQGKSLDEATKYFEDDVSDLEDFRINFTPGIVPGFLRRVPNVNSRVNIRIQ